MSIKRILAGISGVGVAAGVIALGASQAVATGASTSEGAVLGNLTADAAQTINASARPSGFAPSAPSRPALLRNGQPTGTQLPSRPSTGSKSGAAAPAKPQPFGGTIGTQFDGIKLSTSDCGCQPPDVNATIGPNNIVESVNLEYAVYDKAGNLLLRESMNNFFGTNDGLSDPRVLYDPTWNRWQLSLTDTSSPSLWLAYSATGDPTAGFYVYHVGFPYAAGSIIDYPMVGQNRDAFVYTSNNFGPSSYQNSTAFTVQKAFVYNGFGWGAALFGVNYNTTPAIVGGRPTQSATNLYLLSPDDGNNVMYVYTMQNTAESPSLSYLGSIAYNWAAPSRRVNQPGTSTTLDPLDGRIVWATTQLDGRVWFAHGVDISGFPAVHWGWVTPGNMTIHVGSAFHSNTSDDFNPSIAAANNGSGVQETLTWAYTDTPNNIATTDVFDINPGVGLPLKTGSVFSFPSTNSTSEFRFGDYSSVAPEYNPVGSCAEGTWAVVANQYFDNTGAWKTRIARVHKTGC